MSLIFSSHASFDNMKSKSSSIADDVSACCCCGVQFSIGESIGGTAVGLEMLATSVESMSVSPVLECSRVFPSSPFFSWMDNESFRGALGPFPFLEPEYVQGIAKALHRTHPDD